MTTGSGVALIDYDDDGWLDVYFVNGTRLDPEGRVVAAQATSPALFRNRGDGTFGEVTEQAGVAAPTYGQGVACGDYDGDGFVDIYLTNYGPNRLYRNNGDGTFEDVTEQAGVGDERWGTGAVFFDYDGDGDLDLYAANYVKFSPGMKGVHASSYSKRSGFRSFPGPRDYAPDDDVLYRNDGDGTFTDVSEDAGLVPGGRGLTVVASDLDTDGDQDVFVANDASANFLYRNDRGRLVEIAMEAGVALDPDGIETAAMGVDIADVDGDGQQDLYVTNMVFEFNNLYHNLGGMFFEDVTKAVRLDKDNFRHVGWATRFADFDHDGVLDCFVANGHVIDYVEGFSQGITYGQQNMLFLGDGRGRFENVAKRAGRAFRRKKVSRGAAVGDYDNDGDIDIVITNSGGQAELLRNDLPHNDRWIKIRLKGQPPNTYGVGAKVTVEYGERTIFDEVRFLGTYLSSSDPTLHVGLPVEVDEVEIQVDWPSGERGTRSVSPGRMIAISETVHPPRD